MNEEKIDYRKVSPETMMTVKKTVIAQWRAGKKTSEIRENTGLNINTVREIIRKYKEGGMKLCSRKRKDAQKAAKWFSAKNKVPGFGKPSSTKHRIS